MIGGDIWLQGAPILCNLVFVLGFLTIIVGAAQDDTMEIPLLDILHTFISWPSFNQGALLSACIWCFRYVERILSSRHLLIFFAYNLVTFLPFFILVIYLKGFTEHFSFFYFVPFSLYGYVFWHLPSTTVYDFLSDKAVLTLFIILAMILAFPWGFLPLAPALLGNLAWAFDLLWIRKLGVERAPVVSDEPIRQPEPLLRAEAPSEENVNAIVELGFTSGQAIDALSANGDDLQKAIDSLVK
jgi:hypothetical protein